MDASMGTSLHERHPRRHDVPLLVLAGLVTLGIGLFRPVVTLEKLVFSSRTYSVITGVIDLFRGGNVFLAALVFGFSAVFPALKLLLLLVLWFRDRKSTRLNSSHSQISYAVFC